MQTVGLAVREQATLRILTDDVLKTSAIEGERLNTDSVRSSLARRLGVEIGALAPADRLVEGVVEMVLDATPRFALPLTVERLFGWHASLFPSGYGGLSKIRVGHWRDDAQGPMQVVSGPEPRKLGSLVLSAHRSDSTVSQRRSSVSDRLTTRVWSRPKRAH